MLVVVVAFLMAALRLIDEEGVLLVDRRQRLIVLLRCFELIHGTSSFDLVSCGQGFDQPSIDFQLVWVAFDRQTLILLAGPSGDLVPSIWVVF